MADRRVTATGKDTDGDILRLCHAGEWWSPRGRASVINDIESNAHTYYVEDRRGRSDIHVSSRNGRKYLRTDPDGRSSNNLDNLPDC